MLSARCFQIFKRICELTCDELGDQHVTCVNMTQPIHTRKHAKVTNVAHLQEADAPWSAATRPAN